jgi:hypothetical protein
MATGTAMPFSTKYRVPDHKIPGNAAPGVPEVREVLGVPEVLGVIATIKTGGAANSMRVASP